jgi:hypothetical protein
MGWPIFIKPSHSLPAAAGKTGVEKYPLLTAAGMAFSLKNFLGLNSEGQTAVLNLRQIPQQPQPVPVAANDDTPVTQEDNDPSPVTSANDALSEAAREITVQRKLPGNKTVDRKFPVRGVYLTDDVTGMDMGVCIGDEEATPSARVVVELSKPAGDYTKASLQAAVQKLVGAIPLLKQANYTIEHKDAAAEKPVAIVEALKVALAEHKKTHPEAKPPFSDSEIALLDKYFHEANTPGHYIGWDHIRVAAKDGKLLAQFWVDHDAKSDHGVIAGDKEIEDFLAAPERKATILAKMKEKLKNHDPALPIAAEQIDKLEMEVSKKPSADGYGGGELTTAEFHIPGEPAEGTKFADLDPKLVDDLFTQSLIESSEELPPILSRLADGAMMKTIIGQRCKDVAGIDQVLDHDIFKDREERNKTRAAKRDPEHPVLPEPVVNESHDPSKPDTVVVNFTLAKNPATGKPITMDELRDNVHEQATEMAQSLKAESAISR